jgi:hypothetical protein
VGFQEWKGELGEGLGGRIEAKNPIFRVFAALMRLGKDLVGCLAKIMNDANCGKTFNWIDYVVQIFGTMIRQVMEHVDTLDGRLSALLGSKNEIDPLVKMATDIRALESLSVLSYEDLGISFRPRR